MTVLISGHSFHYEMENLCRLFFHHQPIRVLENGERGEDSILLFTGVVHTSFGGRILVSLQTKTGTAIRCEAFGRELFLDEQEIERRMGVLVFGLLCDFCGIRPRWGILTGVRPVKLLRSLKERHGEEEALRLFQDRYLVTPEKTELSRATMWNEQIILDRSRKDSFSLYISIPFCPTRCSYCSFVSSSVEKSMKLVPEYVEKLCEEIRYTCLLYTSGRTALRPLRPQGNGNAGDGRRTLLPLCVYHRTGCVGLRSLYAQNSVKIYVKPLHIRRDMLKCIRKRPPSQQTV